MVEFYLLSTGFHSFRVEKRRKFPLVKQKGGERGAKREQNGSYPKPKKLKIFKSAQNAFQYDFLVFLDHFKVIFYDFQ